MSIKWKEIKEICKKYDISLGYTDIRFADIPFTKQFFKRRPKYQVFLYDGDIYKHDFEYLPTIQRYTGSGNGNYENAPMFFNIPNSYEGLSSWEIDEFLEKGTMPQSHFRKWYGKWRAIYTAKDFEKAILELKEHLELGTKIQTSSDLKQYREQYLKIKKELEQKQLEMDSIKKKYKQCFCKQAGIVNDF